MKGAGSASSTHLWGRLLAYLKPHWRAEAIGLSALVVANGLGAYLPLLIRNGVDALETAGHWPTLLGQVAAIAGLASLMWVIRMVSRVALFGVGRQVEFDLKQGIYEHLLTLEAAYFATTAPGELISRATSDVDNVRRLVGFSVLSLANTILAYGFTLPFMLAIDPLLTLLALGVYPLMLAVVQTFGNQLRVQQLQVQEALADLSDLVQEDASGVSLIKIYAQEANEQQAFAALNQTLLQANLTLARTRSILFPLLGGVASISFLLLLWLGSAAIERQALTIGDLVAMLIYVERLVFPTALLGFTITALQRGEVSLNRVEALITEPPGIQDSPTAPALSVDQIRGHLEARHLTYAYPGHGRPALVDVSFQIQPGEMVAVVGAIGSGKSTLGNALVRLIDIAPGQLFLDGHDLTQMPLGTLREAIILVPQESFLFSTTLADNIRYGEPDALQTAVETAGRRAALHQEVLNFPHQYETLVGERGITLSGGQRQRTALARAFLPQAPVLVLDDALASVDNQTAQGILDHLRRPAGGQTLLLITHRLTAAALADWVLVLDQGRVVQRGSHEALIQVPGVYADLWQQYQQEQRFA